MTDAEASQALAHQCEEQRERCLYTSSSLFIWLRFLRTARIAFVIVPIIFGSLAGWNLLKGHDGAFATVTAVFALLAGLVPAVYAALKLDEHLPTAAQLAGEYKNLEIRFGDLKQIGPFKAFKDFDSEYTQARDRLEKVNAQAYTAPEWCFRAAKKKIGTGHYSFENEKGEAEVTTTSK